MFDSLKDDGDVKFIEGIEAPQMEPQELSDSLVILDDQLDLPLSYLTKLFCVYSHHFR